MVSIQKLKNKSQNGGVKSNERGAMGNELKDRWGCP